MAQLWGGRFTKETNQLVYNFNASISFDKKFYRQDMEGSIAHVKMLGKQGILTEEETKALVTAVKQILQEALENRQVIDLSGCSVSQVLYYVNLGTPVFAMVGDQAVLIIGYDEHNTILYQPMENSARKMGLQDSEAFFAGAGNVFLGYLE